MNQRLKNKEEAILLIDKISKKYTLEVLACALEKNYFTILSWKTGRRTPDKANMEMLRRFVNNIEKEGDRNVEST